MRSPSTSLCTPRLVGVVLSLLVFTGCGGGIFLEIGDDDFDNRAPSVSLAVSPESAAPGQTVRLVAAAADDFGIAQVSFFRSDAAGSVSLGADCCAPYELDTRIPAGALGSVQFFARATDSSGFVGQSPTVNVTVVP